MEKEMTVFHVNHAANPVDSSATRPLLGGTSAAPDSFGTFMGNGRWVLVNDAPVVIEDIVWTPSDSGSTADRKRHY